MDCSLKTISQKEIPLNSAVIWTLRVYAPESMAECIARLQETAL
jgi:hypothetical protein